MNTCSLPKESGRGFRLYGARPNEAFGEGRNAHASIRWLGEQEVEKAIVRDKRGDWSCGVGGKSRWVAGGRPNPTRQGIATRGAETKGTKGG